MFTYEESQRQIQRETKAREAKFAAYLSELRPLGAAAALARVESARRARRERVRATEDYGWWLRKQECLRALRAREDEVLREIGAPIVTEADELSIETARYELAGLYHERARAKARAMLRELDGAVCLVRMPGCW